MRLFYLLIARYPSSAADGLGACAVTEDPPPHKSLHNVIDPI